MTNQEVLIQEVQDEISAEMPERLRVIETAQEKDKEIQSRMARGENWNQSWFRQSRWTFDVPPGYFRDPAGVVFCI